jgi:hypothetical protein
MVPEIASRSPANPLLDAKGRRLFFVASSLSNHFDLPGKRYAVLRDRCHNSRYLGSSEMRSYRPTDAEWTERLGETPNVKEEMIWAARAPHQCRTNNPQENRSEEQLTPPKSSCCHQSVKP